MKNFLHVASNIDVFPVLAQLHQNQELWDKDQWRTDKAIFKSTRDIWLRYTSDYGQFREPHFPVWFGAYQKLPSLRPIIFSMMARMQATHLGGVLITQIPPHGEVLPHVDDSWHAKFYNCKLYLVLETNPQTVFRVEEEEVRMAVGDVWQINNTKLHSVKNDGDTNRTTLIVCLKTE